MRSRMITIDFYRKWCDDIFGQNMWPFVNRVNNEFGGLNLNTNNLIMTNGDEGTFCLIQILGSGLVYKNQRKLTYTLS